MLYYTFAHLADTFDSLTHAFTHSLTHLHPHYCLQLFTIVVMKYTIFSLSLLLSVVSVVHGWSLSECVSDAVSAGAKLFGYSDSTLVHSKHEFELKFPLKVSE